MASWIDNARSDRQGNNVIYRRTELHRTQYEYMRKSCISGPVLTKLNFTRLNTFRDRSIKVRRLRRSEDKSIKDALVIATSPARK